MEQQPRSHNFVPLVPTPPPSSLQTAGASGWYNLTAWAVNVTRYAPFLEELVWAGPRMFMKLGSYMALSEPLDAPPSHHYASTTVGADLLRPLAADPNLYNILEPNPGLPASPGHASVAASEDPLTHASRLSLDGARGLGSVFSYATSKWALSCIAMAIVLNRTHIFAATRRRLRFRWHIRLLLRLAPILLLVVQVCRLLQSIQCQTSPDFARLRWGDSNRSSDLMFSHPSALLNALSSNLLLGATDEQSCVAAGMTPASVPGAPQSLQGSLSLLWPLFGTFCLSHFLETVSCAVQGRPIAAETGMTLFEQSLAFAEADAAVSNQLGWGAFSKTQQASGQSSSSLGSAIALTRSMILKRVNTAPEVLLVAILSSMTHVTSHILGVFDLQAKYRLVNTGFWGLCFMVSIVWSAFSFELGNPSAQGLLRFPTVCIIGFVPHVLVLAGIATCICIYGLALLLSALAPPADEQLSSMSLRQRLAHAHNNMQANVSISDIRITREMDFYTALLRTGFAAITMASEAVYLNEDRGVSLQRHTWLEEARFREVEELQRQCIGMGLPNSRHDQIGTIGLIPVKGGSVAASNGYSRERAAQKLPKGRGERGLRVGTGAAERSSRWLMALEFLLSIGKLVARVGALSVLWVLGAIRIRAQPAWLLWLARRPKSTDDEKKASKLERDLRARRQPTPYDDNTLIPRTDGIDVETEFRRLSGFEDEERLDNDLYRYWLKGGWWGSCDSSGNFEPSPTDDDWDNTSVVSMASAGGDAAEEEGEWESEDDGLRTPTQRSPRLSRGDDDDDDDDDAPFVDSPLGMGDLARLLHPTSREERDEALTLAAHLQSNAVMTRASFRRLEHLRRTRILTTPGLGGSPHGGGGSGPLGRNVRLGADDEERLLEQLLLSRRQASPRAGAVLPIAGPGSVDASAGGGESPPCVVCQSSSRTIIVWPCRCLSLCDDCRVSLAMNNFDKCVCCRRDVMSFSRIFVP
ncbi:Protein ASI3 [Tolypocladium paradoxum]|uniref:Protein ASI3 n=1 Tax=Tolypocladium paradoxum TaxID=94208 RepID=A0A2S4L4R3_9HYPO|nr:Protein ASI3 [Tolypocladium paradoxum]